MKILSASQTKELDAYTIEYEPIASVDLMERASLSFVDWYTEHVVAGKTIKIFCGIGNNGGDGLAIARMLTERNYAKVEAYLVYYAEKTSTDFATNLERLKGLLPVQAIHTSTDIPAIHSDDIVIDAIFGSGLTRPAEGIAVEVINAINESNSTILSVDIASGLYMDRATPTSSSIIKPAYTISFQLSKLAFLLPENAPFIGEWHLTDIGLHKEAIANANTSYYYVDEQLIKSIIKKRGKFSHKGTYGHALLITGSHGKMGAAVLAAKACLRTGVGLLTLHVPRCGYEIMQIGAPEAMTLTDTSQTHFTEVPELEKFSTIGIGPGLGTDDETLQAFEELLDRVDEPMVLDADALNMVAKHGALLKRLPSQSILTPHPKEFERLAGKAENDFERLALLRDFAKLYQLVIVLKGAHTAIANPSGEVYFNSTGNPGMATGGTGDVLTGIITSLLAQNYTPFEAAVLGVYMHGLAGDKAAEQKGLMGLIAGDLVDALPQALKQFGL